MAASDKMTFHRIHQIINEHVVLEYVHGDMKLARLKEQLRSSKRWIE